MLEVLWALNLGFNAFLELSRSEVPNDNVYKTYHQRPVYSSEISENLVNEKQYKGKHRRLKTKNFKTSSIQKVSPFPNWCVHKKKTLSIILHSCIKHPIKIYLPCLKIIFCF